jgi:predicted O-methyltransferase YrrM
VHSHEVDDAIEGVEGWLHVHEARALFAAVRQRARSCGSVVAVEIGSYLGRSTIPIAMAAQGQGDSRVYAIDPFPFVDRRFDAFRQNLSQRGLDSVVEVLRLTSHDARAALEGVRVDFLFVDGMHTYENVSEDIADWTPTLVDGAIVAFNDPFDAGVKRALREHVGLRGSPFRAPRWVMNTVMFDHRPTAAWRWKDSVDLVRLRMLLVIGQREHQLRERLRASGRVPARALWLGRRFTIAVLRLLVRAPRAG